MPTLSFHLSLRSTNVKTGPIPVSTSSRATCPKTCRLRGNGCYAENFPLSLHWQAVTDGKRGMRWDRFLAAISQLPHGQLWRHNQAGDLQAPNTEAGRIKLWRLVEANRGRKGFTYSHHKLTPAVAMAFKAATANGFTVNASCESERAADSAMARGLRAVFVVPSGEKRRLWRTADGNRAVVCPAQLHDNITCDRCRLCHSRPQNVAVAFLAHGTAKRKVEAAIGGGVDNA